MDKPSFSVIIPAYRATGTIARAVRSALEQTHAPKEVLVIDDGSPDNLAETLQPFRERVTLIRKQNGGVASARNAGLERATGDLIAFLDADDYWEPEKLRCHADLYERYPQLGLTWSRYYIQEAGQERTFFWGRRSEDMYDRVMSPTGKAAFDLAMLISTITVVVPRRLLEIERFPVDFATAEDRHLWVRVIPVAPVYCISEALSTVCLQPNSLSRSNLGRDCSSVLQLIREYRQLLGWAGRRKWESHTLYRWAALDEHPWPALVRLGRSLLLWPLPYRREEVRTPLARLKVAVVCLLRLVRRARGRRFKPVAPKECAA
jgi:hypothetical protein